MKPYQKINHFPAMYLIARKTFLGKNLKKLSRLCPEDYQFFPRTWILPQEMNDLRYYTQNYYKKQSNLYPGPANKEQQQTQPTQQNTATKEPTKDKIISKKGQQNTSIMIQNQIANGGAELSFKQSLAGGVESPDDQNKQATEAAVELMLDDGVAISKDLGADTSLLASTTQSPGKETLLEQSSMVASPKKESSTNVAAVKEAPMIDLYSTPGGGSPMSKMKKQQSSNNQFNGSKKTQYLTFIVKPDCLSQGKGIFLTNNVDDIAFQANNNNNERIVVQEYLKEPFLIDNLKFDIRLYVLITSCDPLKIFLYHEGIVRFATEEFKSGCLNNANIDNMFIHLTNYAINKDNGKFKHSKNALDDEGHKRSFQTVMNRLRTQGHDVDSLLLQIKDIIVKTMLCIQPDLLHNYRTCQPADRECSMCFELLGFDIILDKNLKPYLLEVNHAPSFNTDTPLDFLIKKQLLFDTLKLLGVSVDEKKRIIQHLHDMKHQRLLQKQTLKEKVDTLTRQLREKQRAREEYELENLGGYDRIYPLSSEDPRQQRYNEIVKAVYNNEAETQIRKVTNATQDAKKKQELINKAAREKALEAIANPLKRTEKPPIAQSNPDEVKERLAVPKHMMNHSQRVQHQPHQIVFKRDPNYIPPEQLLKLAQQPFAGTLSSADFPPYPLLSLLEQASDPQTAGNNRKHHSHNNNTINNPLTSPFDPDPYSLAKELLLTSSPEASANANHYKSANSPNAALMRQNHFSMHGGAQSSQLGVQQKGGFRMSGGGVGAKAGSLQPQVAKWVYTWDGGQASQMISNIASTGGNKEQHSTAKEYITHQIGMGAGIVGKPLRLNNPSQEHQLFQPLTSNHHYLLPPPHLLLANQKDQSINQQQNSPHSKSVSQPMTLNPNIIHMQPNYTLQQSPINQLMTGGSQQGSRMSDLTKLGNTSPTPQQRLAGASLIPMPPNPQFSVKKFMPQNPAAQQVNTMPQSPTGQSTGTYSQLSNNVLPQLAIQHKSLQLPPTNSMQSQKKLLDVKVGPHSQLQTNSYQVSGAGINNQGSYNSGLDKNLVANFKEQFQNTLEVMEENNRGGGIALSRQQRINNNLSNNSNSLNANFSTPTHQLQSNSYQSNSAQRHTNLQNLTEQLLLHSQQQSHLSNNHANSHSGNLAAQQDKTLLFLQGTSPANNDAANWPRGVSINGGSQKLKKEDYAKMMLQITTGGQINETGLAATGLGALGVGGLGLSAQMQQNAGLIIKQSSMVQKKIQNIGLVPNFNQRPPGVVSLTQNNSKLSGSIIQQQKQDSFKAGPNNSGGNGTTSISTTILQFDDGTNNAASRANILSQSHGPSNYSGNAVVGQQQQTASSILHMSPSPFQKIQKLQYQSTVGNNLALGLGSVNEEGGSPMQGGGRGYAHHNHHHHGGGSAALQTPQPLRHQLSLNANGKQMNLANTQQLGGMIRQNSQTLQQMSEGNSAGKVAGFAFKEHIASLQNQISQTPQSVKNQQPPPPSNINATPLMSQIFLQQQAHPKIHSNFLQHNFLNSSKT